MEFLSPSFHHPAAMFFELLLVWGRWRRIPAWGGAGTAHALLLVLWAHGALLAARNIPIFAIVAAPLAAEALQHGLDRAAEWNVAAWLRRAGGTL